MAKMSKESVLYMGPELLNRSAKIKTQGAACNKCMMFFERPSQCAIVHQGGNPIVSGDRGVCGLFVGGDSRPDVSQGHMPMKLVPRKDAGYYEGSGVPTHCGNCEHFQGYSALGLCAKVEGTVHQNGCCNDWSLKENAGIENVKFEDAGL